MCCILWFSSVNISKFEHVFKFSTKFEPMLTTIEVPFHHTVRKFVSISADSAENIIFLSSAESQQLLL
jgi:hypothetical protein